ncbi:MAG TPA: DUF371 domain-containing protein [Nitrososphaeraceae archaeon]|nr:DUF371 domain-containing protein [Nitrososphaeraceae archaeon]
MEEEITFQGHINVLSLHSRTIEITKDPNLTKKGDCILGVSANKACNDLNSSLKDRLKKSSTFVKISIVVDPFVFELSGYGSNALQVSHGHDIVLRKSNYVDSRTLAVSCDKSAFDIPRNLVSLLTIPETKGIMRISVE